jgi:hypothetical protein
MDRTHVRKIGLFLLIASAIGLFSSNMFRLSPWGGGAVSYFLGAMSSYAFYGIFVGVLLFVFPLLLPHNKETKNGPVVLGTVVSVQPTGTRVNGQPLLKITLEFGTFDGRNVRACDSRVVSFTELAKIQPGATLPMRYNPKNPQQIMVVKDASPEMLQNAFDAHRLKTGQVSQEMLDIRRQGVKASGVVLSAQPTGNIINGCAEISLHLKVSRPENGGKFEATVLKPVEQSLLSQVQPGSVIDVFYMPGNEKNLVIGLKTV